ncbi:DPP IV N-terminal domain-containing protein [Nannocystis pusilla]|uniref:S9 family peptidase n=1 Tax=Nannocystis pusilla TaxID=889268 RepID=UPI003DA21D55
MIHRTLALTAALALAAACDAHARKHAATAAPVVTDSLEARLERAEQLLRRPEGIRDSLSGQVWLPDGRFVHWPGVGPNHGTFEVVDPQARTVAPLLAPAELRAALAGVAVPEHYLQFALAPDDARLVFRIADRSFALGLADRKVVALAEDDVATHLLAPDTVLAPDRRALLVRRGEGFAVLAADGRVVVARDGESDSTISYQNPRAAWSPDSRFVAVWRRDARAAHKIPIVDYTRALETVKQVPYVKTGTPLVRVELHLVEPATGRVVKAALPGDESYDWLAGWRPDGGEALVLRLTRDGKRLDLLAVTPATGAARLVVREERPDSFVADLGFEVGGWQQQVVPLADGLLWMSERDGWRHVYRYDYSGQLQRQITRGAFPVHQVLAVTPERDALLVVASAEPAAPYDRLVYRVPIAGGALTRVSAEPGLHRASVSPSGSHYIDGHSARTRPRAWDVIAVADGAAFRYAEADASADAALGYRPPEAIVATAADGVTPLHGALFKPVDFDPRRRYAVIDMIYAGPFVSVVPWSYVGTSESRIAEGLAQMGFVVMVLDARGTPGRGKAFQDATYGRLGQLEILDHLAALDQAAATRPYMDLDRLGVYGHSWGGYFALRAMLTAPDRFVAGYAGAPGDLTEDALVNEPNLGLLAANPAGYQAGSNLALAGNLRGALKLMHGTSDDQAPLSTTMRMADALIRADKRFELLIMPGDGHNPERRRYYYDDVPAILRRQARPAAVGRVAGRGTRRPALARVGTRRGLLVTCERARERDDDFRSQRHLAAPRERRGSRAGAAVRAFTASHHELVPPAPARRSGYDGRHGNTIRGHRAWAARRHRRGVHRGSACDRRWTRRRADRGARQPRHPVARERQGGLRTRHARDRRRRGDPGESRTTAALRFGRGGRPVVRRRRARGHHRRRALLPGTRRRPRRARRRCPRREVGRRVRRCEPRQLAGGASILHDAAPGRQRRGVPQRRPRRGPPVRARALLDLRRSGRRSHLLRRAGSPAPVNSRRMRTHSPRCGAPRPRVRGRPVDDPAHS